MKLLVLLLPTLLVGVYAATAPSDDKNQDKQPVKLDFDSCKFAYDKCQKQWVTSTTDDNTVDQRCKGVMSWRTCLANATEDGYCTGAEAVPAVLLKLESTYCDSAESSGCIMILDSCKKTWQDDSAKDPNADKCTLAKNWIKCADTAVSTGHCKRIPNEVDTEEKKQCAAYTTDVECTKVVESCENQWKAMYADSHANQVKCKLAHTWSRCLNAAVRSTQCQRVAVEHPHTLAVQTAFCVIQASSDPCQDGKDRCRDTWSIQLYTARGQVARCNAATSWKNCLSSPSLVAKCSKAIQISDEMKYATAVYCNVDSGEESCASRQDKCDSQHKLVDRVSSFNRCASAKEWRLCLDDLSKQGCPVVIPIALQKEEASFCRSNDSKTSDLQEKLCRGRITKCGADFHRTDAGQDRCKQAKALNLCIEQLIDVCNIKTFSLALRILEVKSCRSKLVCLSKQAECRTEYNKKVKLTGESCSYAREWRHCLEDLTTTQTCQSAVKMPSELTDAEVKYCNKSAISCGDEQAKCKKTFDNAAPGSDGCVNARQWNACLQVVKKSCEFTFPMEMHVAMAVSCPSSGSPKV